MEYYFTPQENVDIVKKQLVIGGSEFIHLTKVLRKTNGELIKVTDGQLNVYECVITMIGDSSITCIITGIENNLFEPAVDISLYLSPLKNLSRFEFAIEKAVELGVKSIYPVITEHTISKKSFGNSKIERFKNIILSAMKQSQRCYLPIIHNAITFDRMLESAIKEKNKFVMYEFSNSTDECVIDQSFKDVSVLIGPEGGFSNNEIIKLTNSGWRVRSLGKRKLRAETAAIISLHTILNT